MIRLIRERFIFPSAVFALTYRRSPPPDKENPMLSQILTAGVALIHLYIVWLEMTQWATPRGRKVFGTTAEFAAASKVLAANQGLYNGFLAAALIWALLAGLQGAGWQMGVYGLLCVIIAGLYGAATVSRRIFYVQTVPAGLALLALLAGL